MQARKVRVTWLYFFGFGGRLVAEFSVWWMTLICYSSTKQANTALKQSNSPANAAVWVPAVPSCCSRVSLSACTCRQLLSLCVGMSTGELFWKPGLSDTFISWSRHFLIQSRCDPMQFALGGPSAEGCDCTISRGPFQSQLFNASVWQMAERAIVLPGTASHRAKNDSAEKGSISLTHQV